MLWRPATRGEEMFLEIHKIIGSKINFESEHDGGLNYLYSQDLYEEFAGYVATIEVFLRCVRRARKELKEHEMISSSNLGSILRREEGLPPSLCDNRKFCEIVKLTGKIVCKSKRDGDLEKAVMDAEKRKDCYLCGVQFSNKSGFERTADHIWPLSMGGATIEENILPACEDCNRKRGHAITWAWWPIQSFYYQHKAGKNPQSELRLSMAMARIMMEASGRGTRRGIISTLKDAARRLWPAFPISDYDTTVPLVYFEMLKKVEI